MACRLAGSIWLRILMTWHSIILFPCGTRSNRRSSLLLAGSRRYPDRAGREAERPACDCHGCSTNQLRQGARPFGSKRERKIAASSGSAKQSAERYNCECRSSYMSNLSTYEARKSHDVRAIVGQPPSCGSDHLTRHKKSSSASAASFLVDQRFVDRVKLRVQSRKPVCLLRRPIVPFLFYFVKGATDQFDWAARLAGRSLPQKEGG